MLLGRDVLDQQVLDAEERPMGKVDGIVLEWHPRAATRVVAVVVGGTTSLWRIHRRLAAWAERRRAGEGRRTVVPWRKVLHVGVDVKVDVEAEPSPALYWERWVRERIVRRIPGA
jgi:sporulation protein YlmC with PRC-barrel domain